MIIISNCLEYRQGVSDKVYIAEVEELVRISTTEKCWS